MIEAATLGPSAYWYLTRGTGTVALVLLTLSVVLGVVNWRRPRSDRVPRFVVDSVHRNVSLLAVAFTVVHVVTSLLDGFAPITVVDAILPFASAYRPLWLGFGAVAFDLLLALVITSLLRRRLGYRAWRLTHWLAYACWPVAVLHTFGTGSDVKFGWMLVLTAVCVTAVVVAALVRATSGWPSRGGARLAAILGCAAVPLGLIIWLPSGPLAKGWAQRAGTPSYLLVSARRAKGKASSTADNTATPPSFRAQVNGTVTQGQAGNGLAIVEVSTTVAGEPLNTLHIRIVGQPLEGGGVQMTSSRVTLGSASHSREYRGVITALQGTDLAAELRSSSGSVVRLLAQLQIDLASGTVSGTVQVAPAGA
jgi:Ferric reductase like transmembrane component